ncbi:hypothetical protein AVEN_119317-1 [Araneus ventricosus]|uniref:Uncharacterized protein n=1 Tax=Araneus ventricosus TaxID=182803 RepID=A0A4Y2RY82_ARAVE|nr:hypothetical protein AVEN_119317-1 [Araneus ventricosus]
MPLFHHTSPLLLYNPDGGNITRTGIHILLILDKTTQQMQFESPHRNEDEHHFSFFPKNHLAASDSRIILLQVDQGPLHTLALRHRKKQRLIGQACVRRYFRDL